MGGGEAELVEGEGCVADGVDQHHASADELLRRDRSEERPAGDPRPALPLVLEVDGEPTHPDGWDGFGARRPIWPGTGPVRPRRTRGSNSRRCASSPASSSSRSDVTASRVPMLRLACSANQRFNVGSPQSNAFRCAFEGFARSNRWCLTEVSAGDALWPSKSLDEPRLGAQGVQQGDELIPGGLPATKRRWSASTSWARSIAEVVKNSVTLCPVWSAWRITVVRCSEPQVEAGFLVVAAILVS